MLSDRSGGFCDALVSVGVLAFALMAMGACGGEVMVGSPTPGGSGGFGGSIAQSGCTLDDSANVPAKLSGPLPSGGAVTLAVDQLLVGDWDANGQPDPDAWQQHGYNIDCKFTDAGSTDVCGAAPDGTVWPDAPAGRDNNFGWIIVDLLGGSLDANARIASGDWTLVVRFPALGPEATQVGVDAEFYDGRDLGHAPAFDGSDVWPVATRRQLAGGYLSADVWVSGTPVTLRLALSVESEPFYVTLHHAIITAVLSPDRSAATHGQLAGIIDKDELNLEMHRLETTINPALCKIPGIPFDLGQAADILVDGTQDPSRTCDGISAGFAFTMRRAQTGQKVDAEAIPPGPCPPATP